MRHGGWRMDKGGIVLRNKRSRDYLGGALMTVLGVGAAVQGASYSIGSLSRMGPGYFPVALGTILAFIGMAITIQARFARSEQDVAPLPPEWRGWTCIVASIIAFVACATYLGLVAASFAVAFISALGDRRNSIKNAIVLGACMVAVAVIVFSWGLQLQLPLFASR